jgi:hypothetical protein
MSARVDIEAQSAASGAGATLLAPGIPAAVAPVSLDPDDRWGGHSLPNDHPAWMRDTISISQRARALLANIKPVVLNVIAAWEHRVRAIFVSGRRLSVDPSGSYRLD